MIRMGDVEFSDESHQEGLHLDNPAQKVVFSSRKSKGHERLSTHATRHPRQLLTPPENVELNEWGSIIDASTRILCVNIQVSIHPDG